MFDAEYWVVFIQFPKNFQKFLYYLVQGAQIEQFLKTLSIIYLLE